MLQCPARHFAVNFYNLTFDASAHPHEDWAETVAGLLHLRDIRESYDATGLRLVFDPTAAAGAVVDTTAVSIMCEIGIGLALNLANRRMGLAKIIFAE